ncbi:Holliday junction resolvase RecU [Lachnoanaerobaculum orale]|uniref:Holliday junction resolvase RecU n=1 Tax=Lachnoanaerobaculum orale TaxID=979627 RepID=UPI0023A889BA|nr:Holliday junction resolvase RecU [Lachnoanaerobaculum orale]
MGTWKTRGLRGSALEEYINYSNEKYREAGLALIQKIPTPITPIDIDKSTRHITLAYFDKKSTVDYIGVVQGLPVCFDAKECAAESFSLANVHEHQFKFMCEFEKQGGIAFLIIFFKSLDKIMYVPLSDLRVFMDRMYAGGKKSFKFEELNLEYEIPKKGDIIVHYLESLSLYLLDR